MKSGERVGILGVGSYVPPTVRKNDWWPAEFTTRFEERRDKDVTSPDKFLARAKNAAQRVQFEHMLESYNDPFRGAVERRVLDADKAPSFMEIEAAKKALQSSGMDPADIDTIIVYSLPPDHPLPCNGGIIQSALGAKKAQVIGVDTACASFIGGVMVADALIRADQAKNALVVCSGTQTRLVDVEDPGCVNFGDGAGAVVLGAVPSQYGFEAHSVRNVPAYNKSICVGPHSEKPWYEVGGPMYLHSRHIDIGKEAVANSCELAVEAVDSVLNRAAIDRQRITHWYSHQPMTWFSPACRKASGLGHAKSIDNFRKYAGMGPGNIPVALDEAFRQGDLQPGDKVMLYSCGAGFSWAASVVTWSMRK